jgi:hypothetical protein
MKNPKVIKNVRDEGILRLESITAVTDAMVREQGRYYHGESMQAILAAVNSEGCFPEIKIRNVAVIPLGAVMDLAYSGQAKHSKRPLGRTLTFEQYIRAGKPTTLKVNYGERITALESEVQQA